MYNLVYIQMSKVRQKSDKEYLKKKIEIFVR